MSIDTLKLIQLELCPAQEFAGVGYLENVSRLETLPASAAFLQIPRIRIMRWLRTTTWIRRDVCGRESVDFLSQLWHYLLLVSFMQPRHSFATATYDCAGIDSATLVDDTVISILKRRASTANVLRAILVHPNRSIMQSLASTL